MQQHISREELTSLGVKAFGANLNKSCSTHDQLRFGRKGSKLINVTTGGFFDFEAGEGGGFGQLLKLAGEQPEYQARNWKPKPRNTIEHDQAKQKQSKLKLAQQIWKDALSFQASLAETYLRAKRSIQLDRITNLNLEALRFHPACAFGKITRPALVAAVTNIQTGDFQGIHRTALDADGAKATDLPNAKLTLGTIRGGCIRLVDDTDVTTGLGIAEGIETALSVMATGWTPVWCAISAGGIAKFPPLPAIERLTVFADAGEAGRKAALACGHNWQAAGQKVTIKIARFDDYNADMSLPSDVQEVR